MNNFLVVIFICFSILFIVASCEKTNYDKPFFENIDGKWFIDNESEYIDFMGQDQIFEMNDWEVFGNFSVDEENPNRVYVIYEDLDGEMHSHYMYLHSYMGSNRSMWVDDAPMHEGERVLMFRPTE